MRFNEILDEKLMTFGPSAYPKFGHVVIIAGGAGCFAPDTLVQTNDLAKAIRDINIGDTVKSLNINTNEIELQSVTNTFSYSTNSKRLVEVEFEDGEKVICTEDHEFYVDGNWIAAKDLI